MLGRGEEMPALAVYALLRRGDTTIGIAEHELPGAIGHIVVLLLSRVGAFTGGGDGDVAVEKRALHVAPVQLPEQSRRGGRRRGSRLRSRRGEGRCRLPPQLVRRVVEQQLVPVVDEAREGDLGGGRPGGGRGRARRGGRLGGERGVEHRRRHQLLRPARVGPHGEHAGRAPRRAVEVEEHRRRRLRLEERGGRRRGRRREGEHWLRRRGLVHVGRRGCGVGGRAWQRRVAVFVGGGDDAARVAVVVRPEAERGRQPRPPPFLLESKAEQLSVTF